MVSTWDVSRKQIGDAASLAARRHGWWKGTSELLTALRQSGSCFVWKWRSKKNQNIVIFPKMCLFKTEKLRKIDNIQVIEKLLRNRPQTYPNIPKQLVAPGREGFGDPGPCTSREGLVTILNLPMAVPAIDLNQLCTGIVHLLSEFSMTEKHKSLVCWDSSGKKETRVMIMIWIPIFKKISEMIFLSNLATHVTRKSLPWPWARPPRSFRGMAVGCDCHGAEQAVFLLDSLSVPSENRGKPVGGFCSTKVEQKLIESRCDSNYAGSSMSDQNWIKNLKAEASRVTKPRLCWQMNQGMNEHRSLLFYSLPVCPFVILSFQVVCFWVVFPSAWLCRLSSHSILALIDEVATHPEVIVMTRNGVNYVVLKYRVTFMETRIAGCSRERGSVQFNSNQHNFHFASLFIIFYIQTWIKQVFTNKSGVAVALPLWPCSFACIKHFPQNQAADPFSRLFQAWMSLKRKDRVKDAVLQAFSFASLQMDYNGILFQYKTMIDW